MVAVQTCGASQRGQVTLAEKLEARQEWTWRVVNKERDKGDKEQRMQGPEART